jgi:hypothetical protein
MTHYHYYRSDGLNTGDDSGVGVVLFVIFVVILSVLVFCAGPACCMYTRDDVYSYDMDCCSCKECASQPSDNFMQNIWLNKKQPQSFRNWVWIKLPFNKLPEWYKINKTHKEGADEKNKNQSLLTPPPIEDGDAVVSSQA